MGMRWSLRIALLVLAGLTAACGGPSLFTEDARGSRASFDTLWDTFDRGYAGFGPRGVDWDAAYDELSPAADEVGPDELRMVCHELLNRLGDAHVSLRAGDSDFVSDAELDADSHRGEMSLGLIRESYLNSSTLVGQSRQGRGFVHGRIGADIRYLYMPSFAAGDWTQQVPAVVASFAGASAVIVDIRLNSGGSDEVAHALAGLFAAGRRVAYYVQTRNGPQHDDFGPTSQGHVAPQGVRRFTGKVILLTNEQVIGAGELFAMLMATLDNVTVIGEPTFGSFSGVSNTQFLPNGWSFRFSRELYTYPNGGSPEGVGIVPDDVVRNTSEGISLGRDAQLDRALERLGPRRK